MFSKSPCLYRLTVSMVVILALTLFLNLPGVSAGQSEKSIADIQRQAERGDADSQYLLGSLYD